MVKKIEAIIRQEKLEVVKDNLEKIGCNGLTVSEVKGRGEQLGIIEKYRGTEYKVDLIPKIKLEIVTTDDEVDNIAETIRNSAFTGKMGDGKIFISNVEEVIRIRTGEKGIDAI
ncbi:MAG: P-II family nitrogen regulator [Methanosphaera sp.]|uniref:P-II family nitrogen regulator n=1 Tax=Candidatus Methanosphaera massiliense TaxID=3017187 RepID=UPI002380520A|nr:P-II family nitrogen regulator [Candidatus Methanosphaera massiliense]MDE4078940.1 P-II family nitrogen regulator [Candidatus Methanosphaera massiliense]